MKSSPSLQQPVKPCVRKRISHAMNGKSLIVLCNRPDLGTKYAYFSVGPDSLTITYVLVSNGLTIVRRAESLPFADYPEARLVHDGSAWNINELKCWIRFAEEPEGEN